MRKTLMAAAIFAGLGTMSSAAPAFAIPLGPSAIVAVPSAMIAPVKMHQKQLTMSERRVKRRLERKQEHRREMMRGGRR